MTKIFFYLIFFLVSTASLQAQEKKFILKDGVVQLMHVYDSAAVKTAIDLKLNSLDTAAMLSAYNTAIDLKLNISDTTGAFVNNVTKINDSTIRIFKGAAQTDLVIPGNPSGGSMVYPGAGIPLSTGSAWGTSITDNSTNWNTAYTERNQWDGGATGLTAETGRTSLGGTTIGQNMFTSINPSAIRFGRANADNTFDWLSSSDFRTAIGAGSGTVNSGTQYRLGYYAATGTAISEAAAITASRALISDANGVPTHSTTTATQVGLLDIATGRTGTANIVYSNSAALVTPNIGVASGTSVTLASLTANRIPIIGTSGLITDASAYTWTPATSQVNLTTTATAGGFNLTGNDPRYNITSTSSATAAGYVMTNSSADQGSLFIGGSTIAAPFTRAVGFFINATNGFKIYSAGISGVTFAAAQSGVINVTASQYIGSATTAPTALLHIKAGTATASTAPLKLSSGVASQTVKEAGAINYDGSDLTLSDATYAYTLSKTLNGSATLDFGNTTAQTSTDLTITVTGAADGDVVMLGAPNGSVSGADNVLYFAWVSAANTVTVRFSNNNVAAAVDPASGTFKVRVIK